MEDLLSTLIKPERFRLFLVLSSENTLHHDISTLEDVGVPSLDVGRAVSEVLLELRRENHWRFRVPEVVEALIDSTALPLDGKIRVASLYNFGILLDPELELSAASLISELSKRIAIILIWHRPYDHDGVLSWSSSDSRFRLNLSNAFPKVLNLNYEV